MIIKSMSRKTASFAQLTAYMLAPKGARIELAHNLPAVGRDADGVVLAFEDNFAQLPKRANGNALYHEILALPPNEGVPKNEQIAALRKMAERYLELRAREQLAVGVIHAETAHIHMHLMISSNPVLSRKRVRLSKNEFAEIQRDIEGYRLEHFPELGSDCHYAEAQSGLKQRRNEQEAKRRSGKASHKEMLASEIEPILTKAKNKEALDKELGELGLTLYRRGRSVGVVTERGRRYRLATLGLSEVYTEAMIRIELVESRFQSLRRRFPSKSQEREREG